MKYLKINLDSIKIKGDPEDMETLKADVYERISSLIESDDLNFVIDEEDEDDED